MLLSFSKVCVGLLITDPLYVLLFIHVQCTYLYLCIHLFFISFHLIKVLAWSFEDPAKAVGSETEVILITCFNNDLINYS